MPDCSASKVYGELKNSAFLNRNKIRSQFLRTAQLKISTCMCPDDGQCAADGLCASSIVATFLVFTKVSPTQEEER